MSHFNFFSHSHRFIRYMYRSISRFVFVVLFRFHSVLLACLPFYFFLFFGITNHFANCNRNIKFTILFEFINHWMCVHATANKVEFVSGFSFHFIIQETKKHFALWNAHTHINSHFFGSRWMCASFNPF